METTRLLDVAIVVCGREGRNSLSLRARRCFSNGFKARKEVMNNFMFAGEC